MTGDAGDVEQVRLHLSLGCRLERKPQNRIVGQVEAWLRAGRRARGTGGIVHARDSLAVAQEHSSFCERREKKEEVVARVRRDEIDAPGCERRRGVGW